MQDTQEEMLEAFLAAVVYKLADGRIEIDADDILAVEGMTFMVQDTTDGFVITVQDEEGEDVH